MEPICYSLWHKNLTLFSNYTFSADVKSLKCVFGGEKDLWRMGADSICFWASCLGHRSEEQSELCLKGDDTHRNVNGPEYFRGRIITLQKEDGWVSRKRLAVGAPLCYCKPGVKDDLDAQLTRSSCCLVVSLSPSPLLSYSVSLQEFRCESRRIPFCSPPPPNISASFPFI